MASAAFQIGIVLASASVITGMLALAWGAGALGAIGLMFTGFGLLAPDMLEHVQTCSLPAARTEGRGALARL